jgi:hypothetical protein
MLERQLLEIGRPSQVEDATRDLVAGQSAGGAGRPSRTLRSLPAEFIRRPCLPMLRDSLSDVRAAAPPPVRRTWSPPVRTMLRARRALGKCHIAHEVAH